MKNNKFPWNCGDCPMLKTYDMSIDDLTHICLWSKKQIDDCDRYQSAECPMEKHDDEVRDGLIEELYNRHSDDNSWCEFTIDVIVAELVEIAQKLKN